MSELPDFEATYRGAPLLPGSLVAPWNIGGPQPALSGLLAGMTSPVLDAGCGIGETALALAALGHEVVGLDSAPAAVEQATASARERALDATFAVADVTDFGGYDGHFATVVDSSLFHSLPVRRRRDYLRCTARAARPGARLYLSVFSAAASFPRAVRPNTVTEAELRAVVAEFWQIDRIDPSGIRARVPCSVSEGLPTDERGLVTYPAFLLRAVLPG